MEITNQSPDGGGGEFRPLGRPIAEADAGQRLDRYLGLYYRFLSRSSWQRRIRWGGLLVNGRSTRPAVRLKLGDQLLMYYPPEAEPEVDRNIRLLWEDSGVIAVFKPAGLPMHQNGPYQKNTFAEFVAADFGREWAAIHRLDRETSGIVLCGASQHLRGLLARDLAEGRTHKEYLAVVKGCPDKPQWLVNAPIGDPVGSAIRIKKWVVTGGQSAQTHFTVADSCADGALLRARPLTGRTNQIRIHAAWSGHVLFGDKLYHPNEEVFLEYFEKRATTDNVVRQTGFHRHCLHAHVLAFRHPDHGRQCQVESALPEDMKMLWKRISGSKVVGSAVI